MISLIVTLALVGFVVWLVTTYIPMPDLFKKVLYVVVTLVVILYLMRVFGIADIPLPRSR